MGSPSYNESTNGEAISVWYPEAIRIRIAVVTGIARALTSTRVKKVVVALETIPPEEFGARINLAKMETLHVYGAPFPDDPEGLKYFIQDYTELRQYLTKLSSRNHGVIIQYV